MGETSAGGRRQPVGEPGRSGPAPAARPPIRAWKELVLHDDRVADRAALDPLARAEALVHRGREIEARAPGSPEAAVCFREAAELAPRLRTPLAALRELYTTQGRHEMVLQVAERELELPMSPAERAAVHRQCGRVWRDALGDRDQALGHLELAVRDAPEDGACLGDLAVVLEDAGRLRQAADTWARAADRLRGRDRIEALAALARLLVGPLARPGDAERTYRQLLTEDPTHLDGIRALERLASAGHQWSLVVELLERRFELEPEPDARTAAAAAAARIRIHERRDPRGALVWLTRAIEGDAGEAASRPLVDLALAGAAAARASGDGELAIGYFQLARRLAPDSLEALEGLGEACYDAGDLETAESALRRRLARPGSQPNRDLHLGIVAAALEARRAFSDALELQRERLEVDPDLESAHAAIVRLLVALDRPEEAAECLASRAHAAWSAAEASRRYTRAAELVLGPGHRDPRVVPWLRTATELDPRNEEAWSLLVAELFEGGDAPGALEGSTRALDHMSPGEPRRRILLIRANLLEERGDGLLAANAYAEAGEHAGGVEATLCASHLLVADGRWRSAAQALARFAERQVEAPLDARVRVFETLARLRAGPLEDLDGAMSAFRAALALDPERSDLERSLARLEALRPADPANAGWGSRARAGLDRILGRSQAR